MSCSCYQEDYDDTGIECLWCRLLALEVLARNLVIVGALTKSWIYGFDAGQDYSQWSPGCGYPTRT